MPQTRLAIVGSESLLGRDINELISDSGLAKNVKLIGADEDTGIITEREGEPVLITELTAESLGESEIVFLSGSAASALRAIQLAGTLTPGPRLIDLTYAAEDLPGAQLRAPMVEPADYQVPSGSIHVMAHPAAIALALFLMRLEQHYPIRKAIVHVFEPASEHGQRGINELQKQNINLLSFKPLPQEVFDAQLAFNMLAKLGGDAPQPLDEIESRIKRHVKKLQALSSSKIIPSIRLIQAPVFHGHSFSIWVEFAKASTVHDLETALGCPQIEVRNEEVEAPTNAGMAGQSGIAVGAITADSADPQAFWFWAVADNFRIMTENAIAVARPLMGDK